MMLEGQVVNGLLEYIETCNKRELVELYNMVFGEEEKGRGLIKTDVVWKSDRM